MPIHLLVTFTALSHSALTDLSARKLLHSLKGTLTVKRMKLAFVAVATVALVGGTAAYASADAKAAPIAKNTYGYIQFIDNGDKFKVCDTEKDGRGVVGSVHDTREMLDYETDGGDANCDYFTYNVVEGPQYHLEIERIGGGSRAHSAGFYE